MRTLRFKNPAAVRVIEEIAKRQDIPYRRKEVHKPTRVERRIEIDVNDEDLTLVKLGVADMDSIRPIGGWPKL